MLQEERQARILEHLQKQGSGTIKEFCLLTDSSESTVRRDIQTLADSGSLKKIYGGAQSLNRVSTEELDMVRKHSLYSEEKERIGKYAASLIQKDDLVFLDAGTTTEAIARNLTETEATYVTNGLFIAQLLTGRGFNVHVVGGLIRARTEAIVGEEAIKQIKDYNFSISFFGTNGITVDNGFTTPNISEGNFKERALKHSLRAFVVADPSKFGKIYARTFGKLDEAEIITTKLENPIYNQETMVKEVDL